MAACHYRMLLVGVVFFLVCFHGACGNGRSSQEGSFMESKGRPGSESTQTRKATFDPESQLIRNCTAGTTLDNGTDSYENCTYFTLTSILDTILATYDKRIRPGYMTPKNRQPVQVSVTMFVSSVSSISEVDMDFTIDMYFRQRWRDERLAFEQYLEGHPEDLDESVSVAEEMLTRIWWPDTFFANAKKAEFHHATTRNAFLRIDSKGNILHSLRLTVTAMCPMNLIYFPMDSQICSVEIESFGYTNRDIKYFWKDPNAVLVDKSVRLPQYIVRGTKQREKLIKLTTGNYSRISVEFYFQRSMGYYLIQIYIPSTLIVVLSWVSFWLNRSAVPARVALGITTVLTMTTLISSTNASLPKISYLKSIDVYLVTCFVMVFASLLEYACVSYITKRTTPVVSSANRNLNMSDNSPSQGQPEGFKTQIPVSPVVHRNGRRDRSGVGRSGVIEGMIHQQQQQPPPFHSPSSRRPYRSTQPEDSPVLSSDRTPNGTPGHHERQHLLGSSWGGSSRRHDMEQRFRGKPNDQYSPHRCVDSNNFMYSSPFHSGAQQQHGAAIPMMRIPSNGYHRPAYNYLHHNPHQGGVYTQVPHVLHNPNADTGSDLHDIFLLDYDSGDIDEGLAPSSLVNTDEMPGQRCCPTCCTVGMCGIKPSSIDKYSRVLFPLSFTIFNVMYWVTYLYVSDSSHRLVSEFTPL